MQDKTFQLEEAQQQSRWVRARVVEMSHRAQTPHLASALSVVDILSVLYSGVAGVTPETAHDPARDRVILSKGHAATALYATLAYRAFLPEDWLTKFNEAGLHLPEQPSPCCAPGVEWATGSLGHGLSVGAGLALASRIQRRNYRIFVVLSDGECNEGSVWEAAMFAAGQKLDRLVAIVDFNKWQATGRSQEVMALDPLGAKFASFGWEVTEVDGHDHNALHKALTNPVSGKPRAVVAHTVKGKGVSFMEGDNNWHYRVPTAEEVRSALEEIRA